jgi:hypothetical protein
VTDEPTFPSSSQVDQFRAVARSLECDDSEQRFNAALGMIARQKTSVHHASDCAVHNGPAYEEGPCDCGAIKGAR